MSHIQRYIWIILLILPSRSSYEVDQTTPVPPSNLAVTLVIDGATIFVPKVWGLVRTTSLRPWPNGVMAQIRGWSKCRPQIEALEMISDQELIKGIIFKSSSEEQSIDSLRYFFDLEITFEFPMPASNRNWWRRWQDKRVYRFSTDILNLRYHAPGEETPPYISLLQGIRPNDGDAVGDGWRMVMRPYQGRKLYFRFDALDWLAQGGALPRRLAVSSSYGEGIWDHHIRFSQIGWTADFRSQKLPLLLWRARHSSVSDLYDWIGTSPAKRDATRRFMWWEDIQDRPTR